MPTDLSSTLIIIHNLPLPRATLKLAANQLRPAIIDCKTNPQIPSPPDAHHLFQPKFPPSAPLPIPRRQDLPTFFLHARCFSLLFYTPARIRTLRVGTRTPVRSRYFRATGLTSSDLNYPRPANRVRQCHSSRGAAGRLPDAWDDIDLDVYALRHRNASLAEGRLEASANNESCVCGSNARPQHPPDHSIKEIADSIDSGLVVFCALGGGCRARGLPTTVLLGNGRTSMMQKRMKPADRTRFPATAKLAIGCAIYVILSTTVLSHISFRTPLFHRVAGLKTVTLGPNPNHEEYVAPVQHLSQRLRSRV